MYLTDDEQATIMAIREYLMGYFKGSCVQVLTDNNIRITPVNRLTETAHRYERQKQERVDERLLYIGHVPIATLRKEPVSLTFHTLPLTRSHQMKSIHEALKVFMATYLQGVVVEESNEVIYA